MEIKTKFYGTTDGNARYDCPFCNDRKGRFYIYVGNNPNKQGKWICHNCVRFNNKVADEEVTFVEQEEIDEGSLEITYTTSLSDLCKNYLSGRGIETKLDLIPTAISMKNKGKIVMDITNRLMLRCLPVGKVQLEFYNLRGMCGEIPKVLFTPEKYNNIAKKQECVLFNPEFNTVTQKQIVPVICEGDMGAWSVYHESTDKLFVGVAVFGKYVSKTQAEYFANFDEVFIMPDNDAEMSIVLRNIKLLYCCGVKSVSIYNKSQYKGKKDDANDLQQSDKNWFDPKTFYVRYV